MENNKLIAEFMNYPKCSDYWNDGRFLEEDYKDYYYVRGQYDACYNSSNFHVNDMKFGLSWDWLMPVVDKIESMGCEVVHRVGDCVVYKIDEQENYRCIIDIQGVNKLNSAYKAVVEFIKNHKIL
jgi:hypothetical protein|tara:strand:+ start:65 stop:439 length:375 start_codon:yes stop_codon:yes gene_type:complete